MVVGLFCVATDAVLPPTLLDGHVCVGCPGTLALCTVQLAFVQLRRLGAPLLARRLCAPETSQLLAGVCVGLARALMTPSLMILLSRGGSQLVGQCRSLTSLVMIPPCAPSVGEGNSPCQGDSSP